MQTDKTTLTDITIFSADEEFSIFHYLNFTRSTLGKQWLHYFFSNPSSDIRKINATQQIVKAFQAHLQEFGDDISNGTILVIEKFLDYNMDPGAPSGIAGGFLYKLVHGSDYSMIKFSVPHIANFLRGMQQWLQVLQTEKLPASASTFIDRGHHILQTQALAELASFQKDKRFSRKELIDYGKKSYYQHRKQLVELMEIYGRMDAWFSMATAMQEHKLCYPEFIDSATPYIQAKGLYHLLLPKPVPYDLRMDPEHHFVFLTGANMAGKSTLIKSVGAAVYLAHIGMGVPAQEMRLTLFDGILSNINVVDNIAKGESFFYNEVQRIRKTVEQVRTGKWLVLIDELFKGTNVQDAMKCSVAVIKGLIRIKNSLFILSTHLYEIADELKVFPDISFRYFETVVAENELRFTYQLREGVSNDRLGYFILQREKVVEMLENL